MTANGAELFEASSRCNVSFDAQTPMISEKNQFPFNRQPIAAIRKPARLLWGGMPFGSGLTRKKERKCASRKLA